MDTRRSVFAIVASIVVSIGLTASARAQIAGENVNMVSGIYWPGGDPYLQRQNEPTMAVSSVNPQHLMAGANDYRSVDIPDPDYGKMIAGDAWLGVFKSLDGGQTWKSVLLPGYPQECKAIRDENATLPAASQIPLSPLCDYPAAADPVMRAGTDGLFYLGGINFLRDKTKSRLFVARFIDDNNKENGSPTGDISKYDPANPTKFTPTDPIRYLRTIEVWSSERNKAAYPSAPLMFMDKPWIAVDVPRDASQACSFTTAGGQQILAGTVYMAWAQFYQLPDANDPANDYQSDIMLSWSTNCGDTWSTPLKLNTANSTANQGVTISIEPVTGRVFVAWRRARWPRASTGLPAKQTDAIMITRSGGRKKHFAAPRAIAKMVPFDLDSADGQARTQSMPTMAISSDGGASWAHVAWASRAATGESKIYMTTARIHPKPSGDDDDDDPEEYDNETRIVWTTPAPADPSPVGDDVGNTFTNGHQFMPSLTFGQGRLMLLYYDTHLDHTIRYYKPLPPAVDGTWPNGKFYEEELVPGGDLLDANGPSNVFNAGMWDYAAPAGQRLHPWRHTIDVRVASLPWGMNPARGSTLVSRYPFGIRGDEKNPDYLADAPTPVPWRTGYGPAPVLAANKLQVVDGAGNIVREQQLQMNVPGFPLFKGGWVAFMGDFIDLQGPAFVPRSPQWWDFNIQPTATPVFHAVWASNQDVKTPRDFDFTHYTPVTGIKQYPLYYDDGRTIPVQVPAMQCDPGWVGSRDQNIYTSRISEGLHVSSPQNVKLLSSATPTSFIIAARNETSIPMMVRIAASSAAPVTVPGQTSAVVDYSFTSAVASALTSVCATIAPFGTVTRTLFAQLKPGQMTANAPLYVQVDEVKSCGGAPQGRSASLTFNPPVAYASLVQPDGNLPPLSSGEVYTYVTAGTAFWATGTGSTLSSGINNPGMIAPGMIAPGMIAPGMIAPGMIAPGMIAPGMIATGVTYPGMIAPGMIASNYTFPGMIAPGMIAPGMIAPGMIAPGMIADGLSNSAVTDASVATPTLGPSSSDSTPKDFVQVINNTGNTTTTYHVKVVGEGVTTTRPLQLILSKTYFTNAADGCSLKLVPHDQVIASVPNVGKIFLPTDEVDPEVAESSLRNATISLAPGEAGVITLRGFMPLTEFIGTVGKVQTVAVPAAVTPTPGITYAAPAPGQPPLFKPVPAVKVGFTRPGVLWSHVDVAGPSVLPGMVTYSDGASVVGTGALNGAAESEIAAPVVPGSRLSALYSGNAAVGQASATVTVTDVALDVPATAVAGAPVTLAAAVTSSGSPIVDGDVIFYEDVNASLLVPLASSAIGPGGIAQASVTLTNVGTHQIFARHLNSAAYAGVSGYATVSVAALAPIRVTVSPARATLYPGQTQRFTATVTNTTTTSVTWAATAGTIDPAGNYIAPLTPGTYLVRATAVADSVTYDVATVTVSPRITTRTRLNVLTRDASAGTYTLQAAVFPTAAGAPAPSGRVAFVLTAGVNTSSPFESDLQAATGIATLTLNATSLNGVAVYASYEGDVANAPSSAFPLATGVHNPMPDSASTACSDGTYFLATCPAADPNNLRNGYGQDGSFAVHAPSTTTTTITNPGTGAAETIVTDAVTGLTWSQPTDMPNPNPVPVANYTSRTWDQALAYCSSLNAQSYGGYADWRLPTAREAITIADMGRTGSAINLVAAYPYVWQNGGLWTSDAPFGATNGHFILPYNYPVMEAFQDAWAFPGSTCVRGPRIETTGGSYMIDLPGYPDIRVEYGTGLVWEGSQSSTTLDWLGALAYCNTKTLYGLRWRLPTTKELWSIVDITTNHPAVDTSVFPDMRSDLYWSASPIAYQVYSTPNPYPYPDVYPVDFTWGLGTYSTGIPSSSAHWVKCVADIPGNIVMTYVPR